MYALYRMEPGGLFRAGSVRLLELVDRLPAQSVLDEWDGEVDVHPVLAHNMDAAATELGKLLKTEVVWSPAAWMIV